MWQYDNFSHTFVPGQLPSDDTKITACYTRLSQEDEQDGDSGSILNQRDFLLKYCTDLHLSKVFFFSDDGYSGVTFDRPGFKELMDLVEQGRVKSIIVKDHSRLGRNRLAVGLLMERFEDCGVRYIAVADGIDSEKGLDDMVAVRELFNEFYPRDTSKKIRAVFNSKGNSGQRLCTQVPYGYAGNKYGWEIDEEAAQVVRDIFGMCVDGLGPSQIAKQLRAAQVLTPTEYKERKGMSAPGKPPAISYRWSEQVVAKILERREYTGCTVNFKGYKKSYKSKKRIQNPPKKWKVFEKENVNTLYMDNEMILTFMMSQAQAESESLSGNVKWGHRKNFKDGKVYYHYASFLGYRKGPDGLPEIDPDEAAIVRRIFARYLLGQSVHQICRDLMSDGIKTAQGSDSWHDSVVRKMLQNEKYIGDALLQKTFMADLFTHEQRKNMGELPQYYVHGCHPAIIDRDTFQRVQEELARRSSLRKTSSKTKTELGKYCGKYVLSELLVCGECGSPYRRVVWSRPEGKRIVWRCINRLEHGRKICKQSPTWNEADIHAAVTAAMNELFHAQTAKDMLEASITAALAGENGELSLPALEAQIHSLTERQLELFQLAISAGPDCLDYDEEIQRVNMAKTSLIVKKAELEREGRTAAAFDRRMEEIANELEQTAGAITEFDEVTVRQLVSNIKVISKDTLLICFKDGTEITQTV